MSNIVRLSSLSNLNLLGTRFIAKRIRAAIEAAMQESGRTEIDFTGVEVTQSFIDELVGPMFLRSGPSLLDRLAFRNCSENAQAVVSFVVSGRLMDYAKLNDERDSPGDALVQG